MKEYQSLSHTRWDCKYHIVFIPKAAQESGIWGIAKASRRNISRACTAKGIESGWRAFDGRSRSYVFEHPTEAFSIERGGLYQRKERDFDCPSFRRSAEELHRRSILGKRLLCIDGWFGWRNGSSLHSQSGDWGRTLRPNEIGAIAAFRRLLGYQCLWGTQAINLQLCWR